MVSVRALNLKVVRDLWHLRGQVVAISLVIASGVAVLIMAQSTLSALHETTAAYYDRYRFGEIFSSLKRAPEHVAERIADIPGVHTVQTRIVRYATLDIKTFAEPVMGELVSLPEHGQPVLNQIVIRAGRWLEPDSHDEVILSEPFAEAHSLSPGDSLVAILNGNRRKLQIVGIALSPEFIYSIAPGGLMPDDQRFGILWMNRKALAAAYDLEGAFNNVSLQLNRGTAAATVIQQLDELLKRYGSIGAVAREHHLSNWFVQNEISQQATMARILPTIFLVIAAFLTNMVMKRLMTTERSQIGLMKAFGYNNREVGLHYTKIVVGIALVGIIIGALLGRWFGRINTEMYGELFRFPLLIHSINPSSFAIAGGLSILAALTGALGSVREAVKLTPAQAMLPPVPQAFRPNPLLRTRLGLWLDQPTRIILRNILRGPRRALSTGLGFSASVALLVMAQQWTDCIDYLSQSYFFDAQRQSAMVAMAEPQSTSVLYDIAHLPGVLATEPMRMVKADLSFGHITHRGTLSGITTNAWLQPIYDDSRHAVVSTPVDGIVLGSYLAEKLKVRIGDSMWVSVLGGRRPEVQMPIVDLVDSYIGMPAYVHIATLDRLLKERPSVEYVNLLVDRNEEARLYRELKKIPAISTVMLRQASIDSFYATVAENTMVFINMFSALACVMAFGVAYNSSRITLSERGRELATLRVLGFTRGEISYILLGEVALLVSFALPVGCLLGWLLSRLIANSFATELFRLPMIIEPETYGIAIGIVLLTTLLSAAIVRRRVDKLNLIEVLKTRE